MFKRFEKTCRIKIPQISSEKGKHLTSAEANSLLSSDVYIEEKIDGANVGIIRHVNGFSLQKRGSIISTKEHPQFQYFHHWAWQLNFKKVINIPIGITIFGELMFYKHCIFYDKLPDFFIVFDVWDRKKNKYFNYEEKTLFCQKEGFYQVPLINKGKFQINELYDLIPKNSKFGDKCEGIVIKNYKNPRLKGKIVNEDFIKEIDRNNQHWTKNNLVKNQIITKNLVNENKVKMNEIIQNSKTERWSFSNRINKP